jgi:diguanylate cyclase (GGDEF)-like protein
VRITKKWHVAVIGLVSALLAVLVPILVFSHMLAWLPFFILHGLKLVTGVTVFAIALPFALLSLNATRRVNVALMELEQAVRFDPLTKTMTRNHFLMSVEQNRDRSGCLVIADADRFKSINDTYGHEAGDMALKHLSEAMNQQLGPYGLVGRLGGEEFAFYFRKRSASEIRLLLANLGAGLRSAGFDYHGNHIAPSMSFGLVQDDGRRPLASLMRIADQCLYKAKELGRDRCVSEEMLDLTVSAAA